MFILNLDEELASIGRRESEAMFGAKGELRMSSDGQKKKTPYTAVLL